MEIREKFLNDLHNLLKKYNAEITITDHWNGYPECGENVRMTIEFDNFEIKDIDLGRYIDGKRHGGE